MCQLRVALVQRGEGRRAKESLFSVSLSLSIHRTVSVVLVTSVEWRSTCSYPLYLGLYYLLNIFHVVFGFFWAVCARNALRFCCFQVFGLWAGLLKTGLHVNSPSSSDGFIPTFFGFFHNSSEQPDVNSIMATPGQVLLVLTHLNRHRFPLKAEHYLR